MKKAFIILLAVIGMIQFGCTSKTFVSATSRHISPLNYRASFSLNVNSDAAVPFAMHEDTQSLETMWSEVTNGYSINDSNPQYRFDLTLLYTQAIFGKNSMFSVKYYSTALFELKSYDHDQQLVNSELFKVIGMWNDGAGTLKGPVNVSAFNYAKTTRQAIIKLGMIDILSHVSKKSFLNDSDGLHKYFHLPDGDNFVFNPINVTSQKLVASLFLENPTVYYNEYGASLIYLNFIMAENEKTIDETQTEILKTDDGKIMLEIVAKLGHDKRWPLFPKDIDVSVLPYSFE